MEMRFGEFSELEAEFVVDNYARELLALGLLRWWIVILRDVDGYTEQEIAHFTGLTRDEVHSKYRAAISRVRSNLVRGAQGAA